MSDETKDTRLPPPAFPPGSRRHVHTNSDSPGASTPQAGDSSGEAFISPDEPMPDRHDRVDDAFISPDEPFPERVPGLEPEEGIVTGMGDDAHVGPEDLLSGGDPHVLEVMGAVERLSAALKRKGEAGLRAAPHMSRFEATLRAYCVGYIAGRRAEDEADEREYAPYTGPDTED